jgi:hypothetical protein
VGQRAPNALCISCNIHKEQSAGLIGGGGGVLKTGVFACIVMYPLLRLAGLCAAMVPLSVGHAAAGGVATTVGLPL